MFEPELDESMLVGGQECLGSGGLEDGFADFHLHVTPDHCEHGQARNHPIPEPGLKVTHEKADDPRGHLPHRRVATVLHLDHDHVGRRVQHQGLAVHHARVPEGDLPKRPQALGIAGGTLVLLQQVHILGVLHGQVVEQKSLRFEAVRSSGVTHHGQPQIPEPNVDADHAKGP